MLQRYQAGKETLRWKRTLLDNRFWDNNSFEPLSEET